MQASKRIAVVGSREFKNYEQLKEVVLEHFEYGDELVSGGAVGADSMAQRLMKEIGGIITICYPDWNPNGVYDRGAGYRRNKVIVEHADLVLAFYQKGRFQQGGTANTISWAEKLGVPYKEYEEY